MSTIKIILADDELLFRKGILFMLERESNIEIIYEASNGEELVNYLNENQDNLPDIILMDLKMPMLNGVEATKKVHKKFPEIRIIALTSYDTKPFIINMIQEGASSYLVKNASPKEMISTINEVASKGFYYNDLIMSIIHEGLIFGTKKTKSTFDEEYLTTREKEILELICEQLSTNEIAEKLFISPRTVDGHRNNLLLKTESKNIAGLVVYAIQNKIVTLKNITDKM
ncbi:DNA-binding response regulator [Flavobacterium sp. 9AF]|uniref:response regulator transcription factor n=1 Tax=Flavobacterium sp. 9AF TaxID=2653142 RepID=UPI0012F1B27F|nr:response regulator transcription factor [Flavobacterium sp. 9AF]VXB61960.1 DNA-binding response regulator [Flavobacterium sp. 9AF]